MALSRTFTLVLAVVLPLCCGRLAGVPKGLEKALEDIAKSVSSKYNCSISISFRNAEGSASAASGITDFATGRQATTSDLYAWGSVTKILTGSSILRLISQKKFGLDDAVPPHVDGILAKMAKADPSQKFSSLADLWGDNVKNLTFRQLLHMSSGVPDFDTATPCDPRNSSCVPTDPLRQQLYKDPSHGLSPTQLLSVPWVSKWTPCIGQEQFCYSSTNFMILGLILAAEAGDASWSSFDQGHLLPAAMRSSIKFAKTGTPKDHGVVNGYDRTSYDMPKGHLNDHDNLAVAGVFSGWSASDLVASVSTVADLTWEIYGPPSSIAPPAERDLMVPHNEFYGLATQNVAEMGCTGQKGEYGIGYGHLGATYGYQSVVAYFPALKFTLAVASNIETDGQTQPQEAICLAYNTAGGMLLNKTITCSFTSGGYFGGHCKCDTPMDEQMATLMV